MMPTRPRGLAVALATIALLAACQPGSIKLPIR